MAPVLDAYALLKSAATRSTEDVSVHCRSAAPSAVSLISICGSAQWVFGACRVDLGVTHDAAPIVTSLWIQPLDSAAEDLCSPTACDGRSGSSATPERSLEWEGPGSWYVHICRHGCSSCCQPNSSDQHHTRRRSEASLRNPDIHFLVFAPRPASQAGTQFWARRMLRVNAGGVGPVRRLRRRR